MGKVKALAIEMEETGCDFEEAHYHHVLNDIVLMMQEYGYFKVLEDIKKKYDNTIEVRFLE